MKRQLDDLGQNRRLRGFTRRLGSGQTHRVDIGDAAVTERTAAPQITWGEK
jgi:hypothetical protein